MKKIVLYPVLVMLSVLSSVAAPNASQENIVAQMNYCMQALTSIANNKSGAVIQHEYDQLYNNLTIEGIAGLDEINEFRKELMETLGKLEITNEERKVTRRVMSIKRDMAKWQALSSAMSPAMVMTSNPYSGAFNVLLSAARTAIEYNVQQGELSIEELQAMWELRKSDMEEINRLRTRAQDILYNLYSKYKLKEQSRLTEKNANSFNENMTNPDANSRRRFLEDHQTMFREIASYYYYLGMAYLDLNNYSKAKQYFDQYTLMYKRAPIFRYDEMSGLIALARLSNEKGMTNSQKVEQINIALKNLPHNSAAILSCSLTMIYELNNSEDGIKLLRQGLEDPEASDRNLLIMPTINLLSILKKYPAQLADMQQVFKNLDEIDASSYFSLAVYSNKFAWTSLQQMIDIDYDSKHDSKWYSSYYWLYTDRVLEDEMTITLPKKVTYSKGDFYVYIERHDDDEVQIRQLDVSYSNGIDLKKINKVDCFKTNPNLKYLFLDEIVKGETYRVKDGLDYKKIKDETFPRLSEFTLTDGDREDIVDFCKDNYIESDKTVLKTSEIDVDDKEIKTDNDVIFKFKGRKLAYNPHHTKDMSGDYLRIVFRSGVVLMYKYDFDKGIIYDTDSLTPYFYRDNSNSYYPLTRYVFYSETFLKEYNITSLII